MAADKNFYKCDNNLFLHVMKKTGWIVLFVILGFLALSMLLFALTIETPLGNVALIPIEGPIMGNGGTLLGEEAVSSQNIVHFIEQADENPSVKVILLEINSPGGSAVASDEIAAAIKRTEKPVVALIREVGASGGYWVASAADYIVANRMSITGSIGVISSYLEFSGLMSDYGVGYERLVAGKYKDMGTPFRPLTEEEQHIFQQTLEQLHSFFMDEVAKNRNLPAYRVREISTGQFYLGVEALELGLVDALGDRKTAEEYIKQEYQLESIEYVVYQPNVGFFDLLSGVFANYFFSIGEGIGTVLTRQSATLRV